MQRLFLFIPKKTLWLIILLIILAGGLITLITLNRQSTKQPQSPRPIIYQSPLPSAHLTDLQISEIGITTPQDLISKYPGANKQTLESGDQEFSISSTFDARPNEVIFRDNRAVFERTVALQDKALTISSLIARLGQPEKVAPGSSFYGYHMNTYIYATKGSAFIGNPNTDEVFELQSFVPSNVEEYIRNYGQDIYQTQRRGEW